MTNRMDLIKSLVNAASYASGYSISEEALEERFKEIFAQYTKPAAVTERDIQAELDVALKSSAEYVVAVEKLLAEKQVSTRLTDALMAQALPKWIDAAKGKDPFTDDLVAYIEGASCAAVRANPTSGNRYQSTYLAGRPVLL